MLRFAAHPVHAYSTGLPCSTNWFSLFPPENSLFDQTNSLFRGVGNSKLKPHDISGLGGFDPAYSRPNPRNSLFFPCKTGKSVAVIEQRSVIQQILQHLDLWELPQRAPPPRLFPHKLRDLPGFAFRPSRLKPSEPPATRSSGTTSRFGKTEQRLAPRLDPGPVYLFLP